MKTFDEALYEYGENKKRAVDRAVEIFKSLVDEGDLGYVAEVVDVLAEIIELLWEAEEVKEEE